MPSRISTGKRRRSAQGFALVLALLAMMLLTFLGLTLAVTTTTELQISTNYKWSQQALFNAEAGLEVGKRVLRDMNWDTILPAPRYASWTMTTTTWPAQPSAPYNGATRNFENWACDKRGAGLGYGVVLNDGTRVYENLARVPGFPDTTAGVSTNIQGTFTLWIRRPLKTNDDSTLSDYNLDNSSLILTSEGSAPFVPDATNTSGVRQYIAANRSVRTMELRLARLSDAPCQSRAGQAGAGASGAGYGACTELGDKALQGEMGALAAAGATGLGTGKVLDSGRQ